MTGRERRLDYERARLEELSGRRSDVACSPVAFNESGFPVRYLVEYKIHSICAIDETTRRPLFADSFLMEITLPDGYPGVDSMPEFRFLVEDGKGGKIAHPWHPNIRYYGNMAGRVCINLADTYTDIAWGVNRVAEYLRYELYHAVNEAPYPEDQTVAAWVIREAEPAGWLIF